MSPIVPTNNVLPQTPNELSDAATQSATTEALIVEAALKQMFARFLDPFSSFAWEKIEFPKTGSHTNPKSTYTPRKPLLGQEFERDIFIFTHKKRYFPGCYENERLVVNTLLSTHIKCGDFHNVSSSKPDVINLESSRKDLKSHD